ncbi:MAG: competence/damage-inducible protein A [Thermoguttaceae bacterium]|jgi:nicotinamide-nucleotide amidase
MTDSHQGKRARRVVAEIISIGDEITTGVILNTNAPFLSQSLEEIGVRTLYHTTVSDDMTAMVEAFAVAFRRADVVVCTGGLGPTQDDLTRQAVARTLGVDLAFDQASFDHTAELLARRGRQMPESNKIQAYIPKGSRAIYNPNGTAPGFVVEEKRSRLPNIPLSYGSLKTGAELDGEFIFLAFPGVPAEVRDMWLGNEGRYAIERFNDRILEGKRTVYRTKRINCFGAGESVIEAKLPGLIDRDHFPTVGITARNSIITLHVFAEGQSEEECDRQIEEISQEVFSKVGEFIFGEDDVTLATALGNNLRPQCRKVGVLEWGTQGALAKSFDSDLLGFGRVFGESERDKFIQFFGDSSTTPEGQRKRSPRHSSFSSTYYVDNIPISPALQKFYDTERDGQTIDYLLAVGPYPVNRTSGTVDVVFVDFRDPKLPVFRRDTFAFGGQPAIIDALFSNRAMDLLLRNQ